MNEDTIQSIHQHVIAEYPDEACGLVCVVKGRERYIPCRNVADKRGDTFQIASGDYAAAEERGEIVAIIHSHPDGSARPSEGDRVICEQAGLPWHIFAVHRNGEDTEPSVVDMKSMQPSGYKAPLVGRTFVHGVLDCWTLVHDWYQREYNIALPDHPRHDGWWDDGHSDFYSREAFIEGGFEEVPSDSKDLRRGDVIAMQIRSSNQVANHVAVYLGDGLMLHHLYGRLSSRDIYGGYWRDVTRYVMRYKGFPRE